MQTAGGCRNLRVKDERGGEKKRNEEREEKKNGEVYRFRRAVGTILFQV